MDSQEAAVCDAEVGDDAGWPTGVAAGGQTKKQNLDNVGGIGGGSGSPAAGGQTKKQHLDNVGGIAGGSASHAACLRRVAHGDWHDIGGRSAADGSQRATAATTAVAGDTGFKIAIVAASAHRQDCR